MQTAEDIRQRVDQLGDWFHNLDLGGVETAPHHFLGNYPADKWRHIGPALPDRMDGMSVLDVGCNAGFHALECKRRGAAHVLGVDADPRYLAQARLAAEVLELEIEFRELSVYALGEIPGQFDLVLFMGVFYHLRYPLYALDLVVTKTRRQLVFQTMLRGAKPSLAPREDYDFWDHSPFGQPGFPALYFIEHQYAGDPTNWWIPNPAAAEAMLRSAKLEIESHPEAETWICRPRPGTEASVFELELSGKL